MLLGNHLYLLSKVLLTRAGQESPRWRGRGRLTLACPLVLCFDLAWQTDCFETTRVILTCESQIKFRFEF